MQVSVESTSSIERRMTIGVPADEIEKEVEQRLQQAAKTVRINGFRPGKVPAKVVKKRYGQSVREEVVGEVMRNSFVEAIGQEGINPIGYPKFEPKTMEEGQDLEFVAIVEVSPEIEEVDISGLKLEQPAAEIKDKDVKNMIEVLRRQHGTPKSVKRKSKKKDVLTIDFKGFVDGEAFEGGEASDHRLVLGSGKMIPGFEEGLIGSKAGESVELDVTFPEDYGNEALAGKEAKFEVEVKQVEEVVLPEMDEEFFSKYGVSVTTEEEFVTEVTKNMERELKTAVNNNVKQQIVKQLSEQNEVEVPASMLEQEINKMKQEAIQQYGGGQQMDLSQLPSEMFQDQAESRVKTGLLFASIIKNNELKADQDKVEEKIQEIASTYESPEEVVALYQKPEHRGQIEAFVLEEQVVDFVISNVKVKKKKMSYEDAVQSASQAG
ncbi:MAG: trigger factor [Oleiphilus sp.]|nr:MAG: trigger factor [Oleiphilus sp.]